MNDDGSRREGSECDGDISVIGGSNRLIHEGSNGDVGSLHDDSGGFSGQRDSDETSIRDPSSSSMGGTVVALPTRNTRQGISKSFVELELAEHIKDLAAFKGAYSRIHARVLEVQDEGRLMKLVSWSGTSAVMGSLELTIHAIERTIEELRDLLKRLDAGAIFDSDKV